VRIRYASIFVDDQEAALRFYTDALGFVKQSDVPLGDGVRWLTVVSPEDGDGTELVLEPSSHPAVGPFKAALLEDGIPFTMFSVDDIEAEVARLKGLGVRFLTEPTDVGAVVIAVFEDGQGNLLQIAQAKPMA
jgi:catechol 2,3-dioxygenase-like lactoylglutathione lyase family enzyme